MTQIRCPVCNGSGAVEAWFGTGCIPENMQGLKEKTCPACHGSGIQVIFDQPCPIPPQKKWVGRYPQTGGWDP